jgi:protein phosphatase
MTFSNIENEDNKKRARPRISGSKAGIGRSRAKGRIEQTPDILTEENGNGNGHNPLASSSTVTLENPAISAPEVASAPVIPAEPKYNPNDGTLELPDIDIDLNIQFPNTDFGAGEGPGTVDNPRVLKCANIECAYASDVGRQRTNNEDSAVAFVGMVERIDTPFGFFAVADGMGGHENGEIASNIAVRKMMDGVMRDFYLPSKENRPLGVAGETPTEIMVSLINDTNQAIVTEGMTRYRTSMGTTLSCIVLYGPVGIVGHVGDSRIYVLEQESGEFRKISRDHSVVQRLVEAGQLTPEEALDHPQRSFLYMSLGQRGQINADTEILPLADIDRILICSDGLWDMLSDEQISEIIKNTPEPAKACQQLIEAANEAGGADNVTVMVVKL